jgi:hypothetical protein
MNQLRLLVAVSTAVVFLAGCGGSDEGPARADVSGTVTFKGQPLPIGKIIFEPDTSKGNSGPQAFADIKDGKYSTAEGGKGTVGGPHVIRINGWDGKPSNDVETLGKLLFVDFTVNEDLPKDAATTKDIDVPESAAKSVPKDAPVEA